MKMEKKQIKLHCGKISFNPEQTEFICEKLVPKFMKIAKIEGLEEFKQWIINKEFGSTSSQKWIVNLINDYEKQFKGDGVDMPKM